MGEDEKTSVDRINWTVASEDSETLRERYNAWAEDYDHDIGEVEDYLAPEITVVEVAAHVGPDARILDAGCGTGLVGEKLWDTGYRQIEGLDFSAGMLAKAASKSIYTGLHEADLNKPLDLADESFDAVVMVGTTLHVTGGCFAEFARVLKPGGGLFFCGWDKMFEEAGFAETSAKLTAEGKLADMSVSDAFKPLPKSEPHIDYRVYHLRKPR